MKQNGSEFSMIDILLYSEKNRGVIALDKIKKGDIVLFVPHALIVTIE